jgi:Protein of unknown function (DUF3800)
MVLPVVFHFKTSVYLLYLDESGNESDPADKFFVLAGAAVFERVTFFVSQSLEAVQTKHFPGVPPVEFHASPIRTGKGFWRNVPEAKRLEVLDDVADVIANSNDPGVSLFAAAIEKSAALYGEDAVLHATEQILSRFDKFLAKRNELGDPQRGLVVFAEGRFDKRAKVWVREFRQLGTRWGVLRNLSDIPYFASVKETRLLQVADFVAHSVFMLYERRNPSLIHKFIHRFNQRDGTLHGLRHFRPTGAVGPCDCPACYNWNHPGRFGPWF